MSELEKTKIDRRLFERIEDYLATLVLVYPLIREGDKHGFADIAQQRIARLVDGSAVRSSYDFGWYGLGFYFIRRSDGQRVILEPEDEVSRG